MITSIEIALVVDDDILMREFVVETLKRQGIQVFQAENGLEALKMMERDDFDIAFMDLKMPVMGGMELLAQMKEADIATLPVVVTAFGTVEQAVDAMKMGAMDFLMKPFSPEHVELILKRAKELVSLKTENEYLREELGWNLPGGKSLLGQSDSMKVLIRGISQVAGSDSTVLITGESGTGKELVANAIHTLSQRRGNPYIRLNCAAVPDSLMDSELFGHEKGAFTGAINRRPGRFELAGGGTLLLDEISEMKMEVQAKLLRVLQEFEFERVGGNRTIKAGCRVIASSNRDIREQVRAGKFRQDLFFRLNVVPLHVPALRDRVADIPILTAAFLDRYVARNRGKDENLSFTKAAVDVLCAYSWPGNVRELENLVERMTVMVDGSEIDVNDLPVEISGGEVAPLEPANSNTGARDYFCLREIEKDSILMALKKADGNRQRTAHLLGISVRTLRNKLNDYRSEREMAEAV
jgi:two-component system response regulator AtoC